MLTASEWGRRLMVPVLILFFGITGMPFFVKLVVFIMERIEKRGAKPTSSSASMQE